MIAAFDVHYHQDQAKASAVLFEKWDEQEPVAEKSICYSSYGNYLPGEFYKRELEPLSKLIASIDREISVFIIDAYCHLGANMKKGLGAYLHERLNSEVKIIGVAKNKFGDSGEAEEVFRGSSLKPLYVTSIGYGYSEAAAYIRSMHGEFRIPTLLKRVDSLCRGHI